MSEFNASVAQSVEHLICNQQAAGSIPVGGSPGMSSENNVVLYKIFPRTCGFDLEAYCGECDDVFPFLCVDGLVQCPICVEVVIGVCPQCEEEGLTEG